VSAILRDERNVEMNLSIITARARQDRQDTTREEQDREVQQNQTSNIVSGEH
jgi:hypothetical protein